MNSQVGVVSLSLRSLATSLETLRLDYHTFEMHLKAQFKLLNAHIRHIGNEGLS